MTSLQLQYPLKCLPYLSSWVLSLLGLWTRVQSTSCGKMFKHVGNKLLKFCAYAQVQKNLRNILLDRHAMSGRGHAWLLEISQLKLRRVCLILQTKKVSLFYTLGDLCVYMVNVTTDCCKTASLFVAKNALLMHPLPVIWAICSCESSSPSKS